MMKIKNRSIIVDVAKYQPSSVSSYVKNGAKAAIVQVSVSNSIKAPRAKAQIASAKNNNVPDLAYFYACFGASVSQAQKEAKYAVKAAREAGLSKGTYFGVDWENQDNYTGGSASANTSAIMAAMDVLKDAGYKPLLYSSASLLRSKINVKKVTNKYGVCIWVASYPTTAPVSKPNFAYFPSMDGVLIWQFTDNWRGLNVDGNVVLADLSVSCETSHKKAKSKWEPITKTYTLSHALTLHTSPHISAPAIAKLPKGSSVIVDAKLQGPLRLWLRQPRSNDAYGYIVGKDKYGKWQGKLA